MLLRINFEAQYLAVALKAGQFAADIQADDIRELYQNHVAEDVYLEFKQSLFTFPRQPLEMQARLIDDHIDDTLADIVAFANAFGGHIVVGIADDGHRADRLEPLQRRDAIRIAEIIRDRAAVSIKPRILLLEAAPFPMDAKQQDWVVIVTVPVEESRPYMSVFREQTRFTIRDGNRKRSMSPEEIREAFLMGPQQTTIAGIYSEIRNLRALVEQSISAKTDKQ